MTNPERFIQPDSQEAAAKQADELFIHGLLGTLHDTESRGRRVDAAMQAIPLANIARPFAHHRLSRFAGAALIGAVVIGGVILMALPTNNSAFATVSASIQAAKTDGTRRYEMRVAHMPNDVLPEKPSGIVDSNGPNQFLMRIFAPDGHIVVAGRDDKGEWCIRLDGGIEREHPRQAWPNFASINGEAVFADSVDKFLEALESSYNLHAEGLVALPNKPDVKCQHIIADRKPGPARRQAQRVKLWIDPKTKELQRLEMSWPGARLDSADLERLAQPDQGQPDQRPRDRGPDDLGPEGRPPDGPGPDGDRPPEGNRPPDGRPMDDGPPPRDGQPPREGDGPRPLGPPRDGEGPRPPRPEGRPGGPGGPPFGPGLGRPGGPQGPRNGPARRMPPLSRFILERVDAPQFANDWFTPEGHKSDRADPR